MQSLECYFSVYIPHCCATPGINTKITISWVHKQFATTRVHIFFSIYPIAYCHCCHNTPYEFKWLIISFCWRNSEWMCCILFRISSKCVANTWIKIDHYPCCHLVSLYMVSLDCGLVNLKLNFTFLWSPAKRILGQLICHLVLEILVKIGSNTTWTKADLLLVWLPGIHLNAFIWMCFW